MSTLSGSSEVPLQDLLEPLGTSEQEELRAWLRQSSKDSLYFLTKAVLKRSKLTTPLHLQMCDHLQYNGPKTLTLVPRGHYKTTIGAEGYPIWRLINDPNDTILLANATFTNAKKFLRVVASHFETNELFRWIFPDLLPGPNEKWTTEEITVPRQVEVKESSIEAIGVGGTAVGRHYRCIIKDDLVNEDHLLSIDQMNKVVDWHKYSTSLLIHPFKDRELVQGTRWAFYDVYSHIQDNEPDFNVFFRADVDDDGNPVFPEEFDTQTLAAIERRQGPYIYSCQYKNRPTDPARTIIKEDWLVYIDDIPREELAKLYKRCSCYVIIDPAISQKKQGDFTGMVVAFVDDQYNVYVEEAIHERYSPEAMINRVFDFVGIYNPNAVGIELVSLGKALKYPFELAMRERKKWFYIQELQPNTHISKEMRVRASLQPLFAQRKVFIKRSQTALKDELLKFPLGSHDDIVDALAYLPHMWTAGESEITEQAKPERDPFNMAHILDKLQHANVNPTNYPFVMTRRR